MHTTPAAHSHRRRTAASLRTLRSLLIHSHARAATRSTHRAGHSTTAASHSTPRTLHTLHSLHPLHSARTSAATAHSHHALAHTGAAESRRSTRTAERRATTATTNATLIALERAPFAQQLSLALLHPLQRRSWQRLL